MVLRILEITYNHKNTFLLNQYTDLKGQDMRKGPTKLVIYVYFM